MGDTVTKPVKGAEALQVPGQGTGFEEGAH
jgi:hypothetical protein